MLQTARDTAIDTAIMSGAQMAGQQTIQSVQDRARGRQQPAPERSRFDQTMDALGLNQAQNAESAPEGGNTPTEAQGTVKQKNEALNQVLSILTGTPTNRQAEAIIQNPEMLQAFKEVTGIDLTGTKSQQRAAVKEAAAQYEAGEAPAGQVNIDNAAENNYSESINETTPEVTDNGAGRGIEEAGGVSGSPMEGLGGTRAQSSGGPELAGVVLLSQENANKIRGRTRSDGSSGVVVELHDGSADTAAFCSALCRHLYSQLDAGENGVLRYGTSFYETFYTKRDVLLQLLWERAGRRPRMPRSPAAGTG